jgi:molybdate transport system substrate-binding protein
MRAFWIAVWALPMLANGATPVEIKILSAGAVEPGLVKVAEQYRRTTGNKVKIQFGTAPQLERRLNADEVADVLIAPPGLMDALARKNKVDADARVVVGRVGIGVVVRTGALEPDVATLDRFKESLLNADSIVYNQASSGLYLENLFDLLGIGEKLKPKTLRFANGAQVLEHVIQSSSNEVGFGAITEIRQLESNGIKFVGPLPAQIQQYTSYSAAPMKDAPSEEVAQEFVRYLGTPASKAIFSAAGIE